MLVTMDKSELVYRLILPDGKVIEMFACGTVRGVPSGTLVFNNFPILQRALVRRIRREGWEPRTQLPPTLALEDQRMAQTVE